MSVRDGLPHHDEDDDSKGTDDRRFGAVWLQIAEAILHHNLFGAA